MYYDMNYTTFNKLIRIFQYRGENDEIPLALAREFSDLPQSIPLGYLSLGDGYYASVGYQSDQDDGEEPDVPPEEVYLTVRLVKDLPEEKSRAVVAAAEWLFTEEGIRQIDGEPDDLLEFGMHVEQFYERKKQQQQAH